MFFTHGLVKSTAGTFQDHSRLSIGGQTVLGKVIQLIMILMQQALQS